MARYTVKSLREDIADYNEYIAADERLPQGRYVYQPHNGMQGVDFKCPVTGFNNVGLGTSREACTAMIDHYHGLCNTADRAELKALKRGNT